MEDREKQIEEIETIIKSNLAEGSFANTFAKKVAIQIVEHYQSKFTDSIILSKEDKAKLVHINTLKNIKSISQLKELLSNITAINDLMGYNDRELEIRQEERKETTEKDFNSIIQTLEERKERVKSFYGVNESVGVDIAIKTVKELAKQTGVEIKE